MKLRTTENSIRIRIKKSELAELKETKSIEENVNFPSGVLFKFKVSIRQQQDKLSATLVSNELNLSIGADIANQWITTNDVGVEHYLDLSDGNQLHLLLEKDFPCLDRPEEDRSDTFWELAPENPESC